MSTTPVWLSSWRRSERVSAKKVENLVQRTGAAPPPAPPSAQPTRRRPGLHPLYSRRRAPPLWGLGWHCVLEKRQAETGTTWTDVELAKNWVG